MRSCRTFYILTKRIHPFENCHLFEFFTLISCWMTKRVLLVHITQQSQPFIPNQSVTLYYNIGYLNIKFWLALSSWISTAWYCEETFRRCLLQFTHSLEMYVFFGGCFKNYSSSMVFIHWYVALNVLFNREKTV